MFDSLFGPLTAELARCQREAANNQAALMLLLVEKGVFTEEEWASAKARATAWIDRELAEQREAYYAKNPNARERDEFLEKLLEPLSNAAEALGG